MTKDTKPKIEAIYPISTIQTGLLFHHLTEKEDQGFLNVECIIDGSIDINLIKKSWDLAIERHPVLRTSIHWDKIKKPIQVVMPSSTVNWNIIDWSHLAVEEQQKNLIKLKYDNKKNGIDFQKNPLSKINLIKIKENSHYFIWSCHHLLLDGWSSSIILKDVFTYYDAFISGNKANLDHIPSYKSYLNWQKKMDMNAAKGFWQSTFKDFKNPFLFNKTQQKINTLVSNHIVLPEETSLKAQNIAKTYQTTLNTLFQAFWSVIISKYSNTNDIVYGNTVSGRSGDFPNIELIAGMFTNVIPVRTKLDPNLKIQDWLKNIQSQQLKARQYEHITVNEILEWIDSSSNTLFDSLFVFENFPWNDINAGNLKVHSSKSGITTTYPLTLTIKTGNSIHIDLLSDASLFSKEINIWILDSFEDIINELDKNINHTINSLIEHITPIKHNKIESTLLNPEDSNRIDLPKNKTEVELLKIWKTLLKKETISTTDNFFEIGGKSLVAVRMFTMIKDILNTELSPTTLLKHSTITSLASLINNENGLQIQNWNNVVPIRSEGNKVPIFCLHAGGGHVFFYNLLAKYLDKNRPIYAIQPSGLFGILPKHESIKKMAIDYVKEIRMAYPEGPYNILVYCHSTAVGFEMSNILKTEGYTANFIVMDTMAEQEFMTKTRLKMRVLGFLKRLSRHPIDVIGTMVSYRFRKNITPHFINMFGSTEAKNTSKTRIHLINIYNKYQWKPYNLDITLILTKKVNKIFNQEITASWNKITDHVTIVHTKGDHRTLFDEPDVKFVAKTLEECLD